MKPPIRVRLLDASEAKLPEPMESTAHHLPEAATVLDPLFGLPESSIEMGIHRDLASIERLEEAWRNLTPVDSAPFLTFPWNQAWYRTFSGIRTRPLVFEVRDAGETIAILPCYQEGRSIRLAGDRTCDYQDILAVDEMAVLATMREVMAWLAREASGSHFHFEKLSTEGALYRVLHRPDGLPPGTLFFEKSYAPCPVADLRDGLDGYLASLPRKTRQDLRNSLNRLEREAPRARIRVLRDFEVKVDDLWNAAGFHARHFLKDGSSPFSDPRLIDFFGRIAKDPDAGFQLAFLEQEDGPLAVDFGFVRGGRYFGYLTAYDASFSRLSPGKCLLLLRIDRWVKEDGVRALDFLAGDEAYKRSYTGGRGYHVNSVRLMPPSLRNRALQFRLRSDRHLREFAKRVLGKSEAVTGRSRSEAGRSQSLRNRPGQDAAPGWEN